MGKFPPTSAIIVNKDPSRLRIFRLRSHSLARSTRLGELSIKAQAQLDNAQRWLRSQYQPLRLRYDEILQRLIQEDSELIELERRVELIEKSETTKEVDRLKQQVNDLEWHSRCRNLEMHSTRPTEDENPSAKVNQAAKGKTCYT